MYGEHLVLTGQLGALRTLPDLLQPGEPHDDQAQAGRHTVLLTEDTGSHQVSHSLVQTAAPLPGHGLDQLSGLVHLPGLQPTGGHHQPP